MCRSVAFFILRKLQTSGEGMGRGTNGKRCGGNSMMPLGRLISGHTSGVVLIPALKLRPAMLMYGMRGD